MFDNQSREWSSKCESLLVNERFIFNEVILEVAHRFGDELLLWDSWGRMGPPFTPVDEIDAAWLDDIADLLLESDQGDGEAEQRLFEIYESDTGLRPGPQILQASPFGDPPIEVDLQSASISSLTGGSQSIA